MRATQNLSNIGLIKAAPEGYEDPDLHVTPILYNLSVIWGCHVHRKEEEIVVTIIGTYIW